MPHPTWQLVEDIGPDLLESPELAKRKIKRILKASKSAHVRHIYDDYPEIDGRLVEFTSLESIKCLILNPEVGRIAAAVQLRGAIEDDPCECCKGEDTERSRAGGKPVEVASPFQICIRLENVQYGRCGNCVFLSEFCNHGNQEEQRRGFDVRRMISLAKIDRPITKKRKLNVIKDNQDQADDVTGDENIGEDDPGDPEFVILGDLRLPAPPANLKRQADKLEPHLLALENRDMNALPSYPIMDMETSFAQFQATECAAWKKHLDVMVSPDYLVRPSGSLLKLLWHIG